ncbi:MAG: hypothetical protein K9N35_09975 [Candidatus Marinimicrobia bacterium]|nr:hypothetical protein [Candidatus Neomarinimicrobiota bacterium]
MAEVQEQNPSERENFILSKSLLWEDHLESNRSVEEFLLKRIDDISHTSKEDRELVRKT